MTTKKKKAPVTGPIPTAYSRAAGRNLGLASQLYNKYLNTPLQTIDASRSSEMQNALDMLQQATGRSQETSQLLSTLQGGLAGLDSTENQAIRDNAQRAALGDYQTSLAQMQKAQAQGRVRGAAAAAQALDAGANFTQQSLNNESNLEMQNIQEQDTRRQQYADVLKQTQAQEESNRNDYATMLGKAETDENQRNEFNIGQSNNQAAAKAAGITGIADYMQQMKYGDANIAIAKQAYGNGGGGSSGGGGSGSNANNGISSLLPILEQHYPGITQQYNQLTGGA